MQWGKLLRAWRGAQKGNSLRRYRLFCLPGRRGAAREKLPPRRNVPNLPANAPYFSQTILTSFNVFSTFLMIARFFLLLFRTNEIKNLEVNRVFCVVVGLCAGFRQAGREKHCRAKELSP
jgi:hypothetical protein